MSINNGLPTPVTDEVSGWDYDSTLTFRAETVVDMGAVADACRTTLGAKYELLVIWDCQATGTRRVGHRHRLTGATRSTVSSQFTIPPHLIADRVRIERQLVLTEPGTDPPPFSPVAPGSVVLWEDHRDVASIALEGSGGRFPVEAIDFRSQQRPAGAWWLDVTYTHPDDAFLGATRLYLNETHPAVQKLLQEPDSEEARRILSVIQWDATRKLLREAADDERMLSGPFEEGSLGDVVDRMCRSTLRKAPATVFSLSRTDPDRFELILQEAFRLLRDD